MATVRQRQPLTPDVKTLPLMLACALAGIGCVGLGGCAAGTPDAAPPALTTSARTDTATRPAATGRTSATNTTSPAGSLAPTRAEVSLYLHCSPLVYLTFDGAFWEALDAPDPRRVVDPASGQWHLDNDLPGVITRESLDRAVFVSTAEPTGVTVHFQRRAQPYPGCA